MRPKKKTYWSKRRNRRRKEKEKPIGLAAIMTALAATIVASCFLINSMPSQPSTGHTVTSTSELKAAIVDQLSLTYPNQTFVDTAMNTLRQAGYKVDYYPSEKVTVNFYGELPTHRYTVIILRVHSSATGVGVREGPVSFFTSERVDQSKYVYEQLTDQLVSVAFSMDERERGITYFGIFPPFVSQSMKERFQDAVIIMMGCEGLENPLMAEALVEKGAKAYISWDKSVTPYHTDQATTDLLQHLLIRRETIEESVRQTMKEVGEDPIYKGHLVYYPVEAGNYSMQSKVADALISIAETYCKSAYEKEKLTLLK